MRTGTSGTTEEVDISLSTQSAKRHLFIEEVLTGAITRVTTYTPIISPDGTLNEPEPMIPYAPGTIPEEERGEGSEGIYARYANNIFQYAFALTTNILRKNLAKLDRLEPGTPYNDGANAAIYTHLKTIDETNNAFEEGFKVGDVVLKHTGLTGLINAMGKINSTVLELPVNIGFINGFKTFYLATLEGFIEEEEEEMIHNIFSYIFSFGERQVNQVMTPRRKVQAIAHDTPLAEELIVVQEEYPDLKLIRSVKVTFNQLDTSETIINERSIVGVIVYDEIQKLYLIKVDFGDGKVELIHYITIDEAKANDTSLDSFTFNISK